MIDWSIIAGSLPDFLAGLKVTLGLLAISLATGLLLSVPLAVARVSSNPWVSRPVWLYTYVIRGTPLLVQLFIVYYGFAQIDFIRHSALWDLFKNAWFCAWFAFALNTTAYTTEIIAGALKATPHGEIEAARSVGMSSFSLYARILLPSALRRALPQYGNEAVGMMHATAIASTVTLVDLTRVARDVYANHLVTVEAFGTVAIFYFVLTFALVGLFKVAEHYGLRHLRAQTERSTVAISGAEMKTK
ncbi:MAG: ABC transporter permease [Betaproteobacteria bacterium]|nr:MAG: ABC transporter permease [Betaproteobacteria bacterium]